MVVGWSYLFLVPVVASVVVILILWGACAVARRPSRMHREIFQCDICGRVYVTDPKAQLMVPCPRCGMMNEPVRR